jgi:oligopeptide/dipeptide ABC transporter ATP-binding protein
MAEKVLEVKDLRVSFKTDHGIVKAVRGVSFDLYKGETLCIVGESGSGKSVSSKAIMGILANNAIVENGTIMYEGENLLEVSEEEYVNIRGHKIGMIFQDPLSSLNPIMRIGKQITEATLLNGNKLKKLYLDSINNENVAYKNLVTFKKVKTEKIKTKLAEDILTIRSGKKIQANEEIAKLEQRYDVEVYNIKDKSDFDIMNFKDDIKEANTELVKARNSEINEIKKSLKAENLVTAKQDANALSAAEQKIAEIKAKYDALIAENNKKYADFAAERRTQRDAELAKAREAYLAKVNVQKEIIKKKATQEQLEEQKKQIEELKAKAQKELEAVNLEFNSKMPAAKANLVEAKKKAKITVQNYKQEVERTYNSDKSDVDSKHKEVLAELETKYGSQVESAKEALANAGKNSAEYNSLKAAYEKVNSEYNDKLNEENKRYKSEVTRVKTKKVDSLKITKAEAKKRALEIMKEVGIPYPEKRFNQYPFEFSGGMRQRIVIAIALTASPDILICDEPTTALDVTIQAQILELINKLKRERNLSVIFITHDLGVVANMADRVAVMYAGKIVEYGLVEEIFYEPKHPYTWSLLSSIPDVDSKEKLEAIPGTPPNLVYPPKGDAFADRSRYAMEIDYKYEPPYFKVSDTHYAATWLLAPNAPKVEMPKIVAQRIKKSLEGGK